MDKPKFSIIIPNFNQGQFIEEAICSVLDQNYLNKELFIFDGGSTDNSVEVIKKYDKYLKYWESTTDRGQSHAINKGLRLMTGDIFNWLNADDIYVEGVFEFAAEQFKDPKINLIAGNILHFNNEKIIEEKQTKIDKDNIGKTAGMYHMYQPGMFFRTGLLNVLGFLNENYHFAMDRIWWIKYLMNFGFDNFKLIDKPFLKFRLHEDSKTIKGSFPKFYLDTCTLYADLKNLNNDDSFVELFIKLKHYLKDSATFSDYCGKRDLNLINLICNYSLIELANYFHFNQSSKEAKEIWKRINFSMLDLENKILFFKLFLKTTFYLK